VVSVVSPDGTTTSTVVIPATPSTTTPVDNTKDIIIIAVAVSVGSFLIILLVSYLVIRKIRNRQPIEPDAPELSNIGIALKPKEQAREEFDFQDRNNEYKPALPR
jgi:flagellar biosynthesis/type III secretory pathway M-ring protein FliF/YscJ